MKVSIKGTGRALPEKVLTNFDLEKIVDTTNEWILTRTGIKERRIADDKTASSDLAYEAALKALENANLKPEDIDCIIVGTISPDTLFPSTACRLQNRLGCRKIMAFDISAGCTGFIYGLELARNFISSGRYKNVLVVAVEILTKITDWQDRATCVLFGDGAGAAVLAPADDDNYGILSTYLAADGSLGHLLELPAGGSRIPASHESVSNRLHYLTMKGNEVFKSAVRAMEESAIETLKKAGIKESDVDWLIPHQANIRIIDFLKRRLKMPDEKVIITIDKYGNTSASSIPIALDESAREGKFHKGDLILLVAFGAGFTWGGILIRWEKE